MSRFSQLNGHLPLLHGKVDGLLADWSVCAFSQLNILQSCTCIRAGSPTPSLRPFSQLNVCVAPELARYQATPLTSAAAPDTKAFSQLNVLQGNVRILVGSQALSLRPFSQLNAFSLMAAWSSKSLSLCGEAFSQLNAGGRPPLGQTQKEAFSQLNALERQSNNTHGPAVCFRGLKRRAYLHIAHEPRTTRGSVHLEQGIWRNRMK